MIEAYPIKQQGEHELPTVMLMGCRQVHGIERLIQAKQGLLLKVTVDRPQSSDCITKHMILMC